MHAQLVAIEAALEAALSEIRKLKEASKNDIQGKTTGFTAEEEARWFKGKNRTLTAEGLAYIVELCNQGGDVTTLRNRMGLGSTSASKYYRLWEEKVVLES